MSGAGFAWLVDGLPSYRAARVWRRNATTYRRVWPGNLLGHLADPLFYLGVLGYGVGAFMPDVDGVPYVVFLVPGLVAAAGMASAYFEGAFSSYFRLHTQGTFDGILATPVSLADLAAGEMVWAATKGAISALATLGVAAAFGLVPTWWGLLIVPIALLQGIFFGALSLAIAAHMESMDHLNHFYALFIMPAMFVSDVFFPIERLPAAVQTLALASPLTHAVHLARPLSQGAVPADWLLELLWLALAGAAGLALATWSLRRRLIV